MILYFANRGMEILGLASTELNNGFHVTDDTKAEDIDTGVAQFECTIHWTEDSRGLCKSCTEAGNYLLRLNGEEHEFYTIIEAEEDTKDRTIYIYAEDAGMDLLNETVGEFSADSAHPASWYINTFADDSGFEIGVNEISSLSRKLEWTGEATVAERIASVATQFDNAEIGYSFEIDGLTVTHKYIDIYKQRGQDAGVTLRLNREVDRIVTTTSVADLATALYVTGGTPEGEEDPITLVGYVASDGDSDGDIYTNGDGYVRSKSALAEWSRYVNPSETGTGTGDIVHQWSYDTTSQSELFNRAVTQLGKVNHPAVNYEIEVTNLSDNVAIGDYVYIVDEDGGLYLQSRVLQMQTSVCNETVDLTLGEFVINSGGLSSQVSALTSRMSSVEAKATSTAAAVENRTGESFTIQSSVYDANMTWAANGNKIGFADDGTRDVDYFLYVENGDVHLGHGYSDNIYIGENSKMLIMGNGACDTEVVGQTVAIGQMTGSNVSTIRIGTSYSTIYIGGSIYDSSDRTLKTAIEPLTESSLDKLTPVTFKWRDGDNTKHYGYIAQDVREEMPELVKESDSGLLSLAYTEIIPLLHAKIKSLEERIAKLEEANNG